jgi:hypothetical protein
MMAVEAMPTAIAKFHKARDGCGPIEQCQPTLQNSECMRRNEPVLQLQLLFLVRPQRRSAVPSILDTVPAPELERKIRSPRQSLGLVQSSASSPKKSSGW